MADRSCIRVIGARQHNLKNIDVEVPRGSLTVITGLSGSGKSSLAFDTIYAEGQRKYVESLSAHARQFLEQMQKPDVDRIEGLCPTIAIEQRAVVSNPRSTVATTTEIYDFLRVLFARAGEPRCWKCARPIVRQSTSQVVDAVLGGPEGQRIMVLAPLVHRQRGSHKQVIERIAKEGFVRVRIDGEVMLIEDIEPLSPGRKHTLEVVVDRLIIKPQIAVRLADSVELATGLSGSRVIIAAQLLSGAWSDEGYSAALSCPEHGDVRLDDLSPQLFSFNAPLGACAMCHGLGTTLEFDPDLVVPDGDRSLGEGALVAWRQPGKVLAAEYARMLAEFQERFDVSGEIPFRNIPKDKSRILLYGTTGAEAETYGAAFEGVIPNLEGRWQTTESESAKQKLHGFQSEAPCGACKGARLTPQALCVKIAGLSISDVVRKTVAQAAVFFDDLTLTGEAAAVAEPLLGEIRRRLAFMCDVGVDYLSLSRGSASLSGGEWQRIRLATQIGSGLAGICYVLDEPTIGLHARDSVRLTGILTRLASMDNTVIVVEHDPEVISAATHMIDIGPGAGSQGGYLVAAGTLGEVLGCAESLTAKYLTGKRRILLPDERREIDWENSIELRGVTANNLKNLSVRFPLGRLVCVTGVSGSGKSTLVTQVLLRALKRLTGWKAGPTHAGTKAGPTRGGTKAGSTRGGGLRPGAFERLVGGALIDKVIEIDQSPIGRTPRSNPATYVGVFDSVRQLYARTREAKIRGYGPARFSFNVKGGRCEHCEGQGTKRISMHFLPDVFVECSQCLSKRYNRETLEIRYRGKNIADVLAMSVEEATGFFENFSKIRRRLQALKDVGLGYVTLGQSSSTLSGGEAQRIKLAAELHKAANAHAMHVLDEPTTGLHFADVRNLLTVLNRLVDSGHSVVIIEHNLEVIKMADWIIDLGPEGGDSGGSIVVEGTPETVADHPTSHTGRFLKGCLNGHPPLRKRASRTRAATVREP